MENTYSNEQWKTLFIISMAETETFQISNFGRIKTKNKEGDMVLFFPSNIKGYPIINFKLTNGKKTTRYIHKLTAETFIPKVNNSQLYVIHLDFNKSNNHISNLIWVNRAELFAHQANNPNHKKEFNVHSKISKLDVLRKNKHLIWK